MNSARILLSAFLLCSCGPASTQPPVAAEAPAAAAPTVYDDRIVATYPHDPGAFTQGLVYLDGHLYESTGQIGQSTIRRVNIADGRVLQSVPIPPGQFGEGIVNWGDQIVSITWTRRDRLSLGPADAAPARRMALFGRRLGPDPERRRDHHERRQRASFASSTRSTLAERRRVTVTFQGRPVERLNELEWVNGEIFANVWMTAMIARIDPASGRVTGVIDLDRARRREQCRRGQCAERHRLRSCRRPAVRHRQILVAPLRDRHQPPPRLMSEGLRSGWPHMGLAGRVWPCPP